MGGPLKQGHINSKFLTTHARHMKFSGDANMKRSFPKRSSPKPKLFNLLKRIHEIVVHNFLTFLFEAIFAFLHHQLFSKNASPVQTWLWANKECNQVVNI